MMSLGCFGDEEDADVVVVGGEIRLGELMTSHQGSVAGVVMLL